jgi:predicted GIY-YIG superfamily endonuclease
MDKRQVFTVYTVTDPQTQKVVYVGETNNFKSRVRHHTRKPHDSYTGGNIGRFHLHDVIFKEVAFFETRSESFLYQCQLQQKYGLKTDIEIMEDVYKIGRENIRTYNFQKRKLTNEQAQEIRDRYAKGGISQSKLGLEYGINQYSVSCIIRNLTYKS